jgi:endonuclease III
VTCAKDSTNKTDQAKDSAKKTDITRMPKYQDMLEEITKDDVTLRAMLDAYRELCKNDLVTGGPSRYHRALMGMSRNSLESVWVAHQGTTGAIIDINPPMREHGNKENTLEYTSPGNDFTKMANDSMQVLKIFMVSTEHRGIQPIRWNWDYLLLQKLGLLDSNDIEKKNLACLVCLILSAVTTDQACIDCTHKLNQAGLLSVAALLKAEEDDITAEIGTAGVQYRRAHYLKKLAQTLSEEHHGKVPIDYDALCKLPGVGRKSAVLMRNELFGFWAGIGTDAHVFQLCLAFSFLLPDQRRKNLSVNDAEASLRQWVAQWDYRDVNKVFGGFAQLMTQDFNVIKDPVLFLRLVRAIGDYIHKPYHVELLWCMIRLCRDHYRTITK